MARARTELVKEAIPPIKPMVWIKGRPGKPGYMKEDPRLKRAIRAMKHTIRVQVPMDENINKDFGPFEKRPISDYPLIQINTDTSDVEIDQEPEKEITPKEVSLTTFLARSQLVGNQSGDKQEFEPDGTQILIKIEQRSDDSDVAEESMPAPSVVANQTVQSEVSGQDVAQNPQPGTSRAAEIETVDIAGGASESSEEEDAEDQPHKEEIDAAREQVAFQLVKEIMANPETATAMVQALMSTKFEIPTDNGTSRRCGVDFIKIEVPKNARVKRFRLKKEKGKGKGKKSTGHDNAHFLTTCESGKVVEATWIGTPPDHEPYIKNKKVLKSRREEQTCKEAKDNEENQEDKNADQEFLDLGVEADLFADQSNREGKRGEKDETVSSRNNNNEKQIPPTTEQITKKKKKETVPKPKPESDHRKTSESLRPPQSPMYGATNAMPPSSGTFLQRRKVQARTGNDYQKEKEDRRKRTITSPRNQKRKGRPPNPRELREAPHPLRKAIIEEATEMRISGTIPMRTSRRLKPPRKKELD